MFLPGPIIQPRSAANDIPGGPAAILEVSLTALVDLLAEAYVAKLVAATGDHAPSGEGATR